MDSRRRLHVVVESKFRRHSRYPGNWHYAVALPEPLQNVVSVDLVRAFMPNTQQTVHAFNNVIEFRSGSGSIQMLEIPVGTYEPSLLLATITDLLAQAGMSSASVSLSPGTNLVTFQAASTFTLLFGSGPRQTSSIHRYLGFQNVDTVAGTKATGTYPLSLPPPAYVTVTLAEVPRVGCKRRFRLSQEVPSHFSSRPDLEEELFTGLVPFDNDYQTFKFFEAPQADMLRSEFPPVDIRQFTVDIRDDRGTSYDCGNYDHTLVLEVVKLEPMTLPLMCPGNNRLPGRSAWNAQCRLPA